MKKLILLLNPYKVYLVIVLVVVAFFSLAYLGVLKWGIIKVEQDKYVTATGSSQSQQKNEIATFSAGVSVVNAEKATAVNDVNTKSQKIVTAVKQFGVQDKDIKTTNMTVYQDQEAYWDNGVQKYKPGQWRADITVEITLRDIEKASKLADLLATQETTNIYGPNFSLDNLTNNDGTLLASALMDAQRKATILAQAGGKQVGELINVVEGTGYSPYVANIFEAKGMGGGGGASLEAGSTLLTKTVTATYKLK